MVKDVHNAITRYEKAKKKLATDSSILPENRRLFNKWVDIKEKELKRRKGRDQADKIRWCKTLYKYTFLLKQVGSFFDKPLNKVTEKDLKKVYDALEEGKITNAQGKKYGEGTRRDFYNKVFKSDFFEFLGKKELAKKIFTLENKEASEVRYFTKDGLDKIVKSITKFENQLLLYFMFDTGARIGTILNLKIKDFEKRRNTNTKQDYWIVHIRKDYTKSKANRTVGILLEETNKLLDVILNNKKNNKKEDYVFNITYNAVALLVKRASKAASVNTKPDKEIISIHDFRRSSATHMLTKGYSIDYIKKRLGHKPSSTVIDKYVSYLGLEEEEIVIKSQELDYNELRASYKEAIEIIKVLDTNQKEMQNKIKKFENFEKIVKKALLLKK